MLLSRLQQCLYGSILSMSELITVCLLILAPYSHTVHLQLRDGIMFNLPRNRGIDSKE